MAKRPTGKAGVSVKVDWKSVKTSRGPATRVPVLVNALVAGKDDDRQAAYLVHRRRDAIKHLAV